VTRLSDPALQPIADKVARGERLSRDDGLTLFATPDLTGLGAVADAANRRANGDRVFFSANQHLNPTNVCILRKTCVFCSFARTPKEEGAYTRPLDEVFAEAEAARTAPTREFHIVGGLHPKLRLDYYLDLFRGLKERHPDVFIKALTAVEVAHLARIEKLSIADVLLAMKEAGVSTLPGGGAEVFSAATRATIADRKLVAEEWLAVHREAHRLGIPSNCTMLYGHVETLEDRVDHLLALRDLQDETRGFLTYVPLAFHPDHNELGERLGRTGTATTGVDDLKNIAAARLLLDNVPHVKTHWPMVTPFLSQVALHFGCDDVEGTVIYERVYHDAGAHTPMMLAYDDLVRLIRDAGKEPVERNSLYEPVPAEVAAA
jgi:aminodeoxyfutalosine synthase